MAKVNEDEDEQKDIGMALSFIPDIARKQCILEISPGQEAHMRLVKGELKRDVIKSFQVKDPSDGFKIIGLTDKKSGMIVDMAVIVVVKVKGEYMNGPSMSFGKPEKPLSLAEFKLMTDDMVKVSFVKILKDSEFVIDSDDFYKVMDEVEREQDAQDVMYR